MIHEAEPSKLKYPIKPCIHVDDYVAGNLFVALSPEIPLSSFSLEKCFENVHFKNKSKQEWVKILRKIADDLEK